MNQPGLVGCGRYWKRKVRERQGRKDPDAAKQSHGRVHLENCLGISWGRNGRAGEGGGRRKTKRELVKGGAPNSDPRLLIEWTGTDEWTGWRASLVSQGRPRLGKVRARKACKERIIMHQRGLFFFENKQRGLVGVPNPNPNRPPRAGHC